MLLADAAERRRAAAYLAQIEAIARALPVLQQCATTGELFACAASLARAACGFERAVVLTIADGRLRAAETDALADDASDRLRRVLLRTPIELAGRRTADGHFEPRDLCASIAAGAAGLHHWATGVVLVEDRPVAVLLADRDIDAVDALDRAAVEAFAAMLAVAVGAVVLRGRVAELARQLRHVTAFTQAITAEMLTTPIGLAAPPTVMEFPAREQLAAAPDCHRRLRELFTEREAEIAALLVEGRSNRDIAERLCLSPETVKMHVARILRKLDVCNRAAAGTRLLGMMQAA